MAKILPRWSSKLWLPGSWALLWSPQCQYLSRSYFPLSSTFITMSEQSPQVIWTLYLYMYLDYCTMHLSQCSSHIQAHKELTMTGNSFSTCSVTIVVFTSLLTSYHYLPLLVEPVMPWHDTSWSGRKPTGFRPPTSDVPAPCRHSDVVGHRSNPTIILQAWSLFLSFIFPIFC